ncbi:MAG: nuclease-related domain-containing protein [Burkholderiales bacterium]
MGYVMVSFGLAIFFATIALLLRAKRLKVDLSRAASSEACSAVAPVSRNNATVLMLSNYGKELHVTANRKITEALGVIEAQKRLIETVSVERSKIVVGLSGEKVVSDFLQRNLTRQWTIIEGFLGGKGEIDFVLIGPNGVFAIEVKNRNGVINSNGDDWSLTRPDGVTVPLMDNGGRSPAQQINEAAGWLETELVKAGYAVKIPKAVIWSHPKARLGVITNMSIQYLILLGVNAPAHFRKYLALGTALTSDQVSGVVGVIRKIHQNG